jgi:outer membrane receptor protein involved in Fe transport
MCTRALESSRIATGSICLATCLVIGAIAAPVAAQDADVVEEDTAIEEIIVTGSRLRRRDFSAPSPIATIDREALNATGQGTLETALSQMPQFTPHFDRTANNPGNGRASVDLRGLGPQRTLVMLNGRRLAPSGIGTAVDLNNLPQALIQGAEVITGGASTVYGSDAVSGVVNFTLRDDFEGFVLDVSGYATEEGDSNIYDLSMAYGHNFTSGRGNITIFGGYYDRDATYADAREFTSVPWWDDWWGGTLVQGGSAAVPEGLLRSPAVDFGNGPAWTIFDSAGDPREYTDADSYNWAPWNFLQIPLERVNGGLLLNHELTSRAELYVEAFYSRSEVERVLAPVATSAWLEINTDNPILTPATRQLFADNLIPVGGNIVRGLFRKRFEEFGPRILDNTSEYTRVVAGIKGDIRSDWEFDAWVTYTENDELELRLNHGSRSRWQQGLFVDPVTGQCFDPSNGCTAVNMFGEGNISPEAAAFLRLPPLRNRTSREQMLASAFVRGKPFASWAGPVETSFGMEWRRDNGSFEADEYLFTGDTMGASGDAPVIGEEEVLEVYAEMLVPLMDGFRFADYLALEIGGRYSDYDHAGSVDTYKVGLEWIPIPGLGFRSMFQHSVRAPNLLEAFQEQSVSEGSFVGDDPRDDPCSAASEPAANGNVEKCIATGLPADQIGVFEASQFPTLFISGGNPDLEPETADTLTVGVVIAPEAIPNLQVSVDYFDIEMEGEIGSLGAKDACFDVANTGNLFCDLIRRDPITFDVNNVREFNINRGVYRTSGIDTQLTYSMELPPALAIAEAGADLTVNVMWTHVSELVNQNTAFSSELDCAGTFGWPCTDRAGGMTWPTDRVTTRFGYESGDLSAHLSWRWIDKTSNGVAIGAPLIGIPASDLDPAVPYVRQKNYFDLGFAYRFSDNISARLTIANLSDTDPPMMADYVHDKNTDTRMYDIFGRSYTLSFSLNY